MGMSSAVAVMARIRDCAWGESTQTMRFSEETTAASLEAMRQTGRARRMMGRLMVSATSSAASSTSNAKDRRAPEGSPAASSISTRMEKAWIHPFWAAESACSA
eukprot:scaffold10123_cov117-Isochrysis_galbana.AAC.5